MAYSLTKQRRMISYAINRRYLLTLNNEATLSMFFLTILDITDSAQLKHCTMSGLGGNRMDRNVNIEKFASVIDKNIKRRRKTTTLTMK